jgi:hypothetical protein
VGLSAIGILHEASADGLDKLSAQTLQMGELSLPIYAYKDKYTHSFLDSIEESGCMSISSSNF